VAWSAVLARLPGYTLSAPREGNSYKKTILDRA